MKQYVETSIKTKDEVALAVASTESLAISRLLEVTQSGNDTIIEFNHEGRDKSRWVSDDDIDTLKGKLEQTGVIKVTVKTEDTVDYASASYPVKLLFLKNIIAFRQSGADTEILSYKGGSRLVKYIVDETYANLKASVAEGIEQAADGAVGAPTYSFASDSDTGMYRVGANQLGFAAGGVLQGLFGTTGLAVSQIVELIVGVGVQIGSHLRIKALDAITAHAGGGQGSAVLLAGDINNITVCATNADSTILPAALAGMKVSVHNNGAASCNVFPAVGEQVDAGGANVAKAVAAAGKQIFECAANGLWITLL